jgi:segregation and condensation protein B
MTESEILAGLEALIFATDEPITLKELCAILELPRAELKAALDGLMEEYRKESHGLRIHEVAGGYRMTTKPEQGQWVTLLKEKRSAQKLSFAALETLAIIAYKQPITAPEIFEIRGVNTSGVLKTLLERRLIKIAGRKNVIGRPILYSTTKEFLIQFGLKDLSELPQLGQFEELFGENLEKLKALEGVVRNQEQVQTQGEEEKKTDEQPRQEGENPAE